VQCETAPINLWTIFSNQGEEHANINNTYEEVQRINKRNSFGYIEQKKQKIMNSLNFLKKSLENCCNIVEIIEVSPYTKY
jgi:hypothetical protein